MFKLKPITKEGIPQAIIKAERYRMLNEPDFSESICQDILEIEPNNQQAIAILLLSIADQLGRYRLDYSAKVKDLISRLNSEYEKQYFHGIICERQAVSLLSQNFMGGQFTVYEWFTEAMNHYEKAEAIRPAGNDDSILRWNTCVRLIHDHNLHPRSEDPFSTLME
jgi:hypothetical protein